MYHLTGKAVQRTKGPGAVAAAAYRAGARIRDERTGAVHDYSRKKGVLCAHLLFPGGRHREERGSFWNRVETHHRRRDAVVAREIEVSLPHELNPRQREALALGYARELADRYGVAVDVALHEPRRLTEGELAANPDQFHVTDPITGGRHNGNWHAHILLSACHVSLDGSLGKKCEALDPIHCKRNKLPSAIEAERVRWAELCNAALAAAGSGARVDHRSNLERGVESRPSRHLGPTAAAMRRRGKLTSRGSSKFRVVGVAYGIPSPESRRRWKALLFERRFGVALPAELAKQIRFIDVAENVRVETRSETLTIATHRVSYTLGTDAGIDISLLAARQLGWRDIKFSGTDEFVARAASRAAAAGWIVRAANPRQAYIVERAVRLFARAKNENMGQHGGGPVGPRPQGHQPTPRS